MRSTGDALCWIQGSAFSRTAAISISAPLGEHDDTGRLRPEEHAGVRGVPRHLEHLEAGLVQHLAELVEPVEADRVVALARAAVLEHHRALDPEAGGEEVDVHLVHAHAAVALEPDEARLPRADIVAVD